jgi:hypothetical protein
MSNLGREDVERIVENVLRNLSISVVEIRHNTFNIELLLSDNVISQTTFFATSANLNK